MLKKLKSYGLIVLILIISFFFIFNDMSDSNNLYYYLTCFFIIAFSLIKLFYSKAHPFSLNTIFYLFILFFIGIAPVLQFRKSIYFLGENSKLQNEDFLIGNIVFIIAIVTYEVLYSFFAKKKFSYFFLQKNTKNYGATTILLISAIFCFLFLVAFSFSFESIFFRKTIWSNKIEFSNYRLLIINVTRSVPFVMFLFYKLGSNRIIKIEILLLALVLFCNFPMGIPRFKIAIIYLPIIVLYFKTFLKKRVFALSFIVLFLSVFPYLHHFRYNNNLIPEKLFDFEMFTKGHFDSYQNSVNVITNDIVTKGDQLLGAMFFFVPRAIWESKAQGSGHVLAEKLNYGGFSNVAISYFGEGYINFGYFGMFIFVVLLALINAFLDKQFWERQVGISFKTLYLIFIPLEFFVLRGGLLASFAALAIYVFLIGVFNLLLKH